MKAAVVYQAGGPEVLRLEDRPIPKPTPEQVLIRVRAFGLNRSELFTRQGHSPNVRFPRVLGIEAVGTVEDAPAGTVKNGETVATVMGGMGRDFDGSYAEYTCVPLTQVRTVKTKLPWEALGATPEMLQTAWGSLFRALNLQTKERLLIRGGTTSVGLAAASIAQKLGAIVASTTRDQTREPLLRKAGAEHVFIDSGSIAQDVRSLFPEGVDKVLELIGTVTLHDSLRCVRQGGVTCMTGMVGNKWSFDNFEPMEMIPSAVRLTTYDGGVTDFMSMPFQDLVNQVESGELPIQVGRVFRLDQIADAHRAMETNQAGGKIVVLP